MNVGLQKLQELYRSLATQGNDEIHSLESRNDLETLGIRVDRLPVGLDGFDGFVRVDSHDERVPQSFRRKEVTHVPHVKELEATVSKDDRGTLLTQFVEHGHESFRIAVDLLVDGLKEVELGLNHRNEPLSGWFRPPRAARTAPIPGTRLWTGGRSRPSFSFRTARVGSPMRGVNLGFVAFFVPSKSQ